MDDLIKSAALNLDRQLLRLAIELEGGEAGARRLIEAMARSEAHPGSARFLNEAAALLRARKLLGAALFQPSRHTSSRRFHVIDGGRRATSPAA
jgi:hypothetical protein